MTQHIGEKIKYFRKMRKLSQEEVELDLNLGFGALSKIESGKRNPTRETLIKIIDYFHLNIWESIYLLGLKSTGFPEFTDLVKKINSESDIDEIIRLSVNDLCHQLKLNGATICLKEENKIRFTQFTQTWYSQAVMKLIGLIYSKIYLSLEEDKNFIVQSIKQNKVLYTETCSDFVMPVLSKNKADLLQKVSGTKSCIILPLKFSSQSPLGAVVFSKNYVDDFSSELPILECFCEVIAESLEKNSFKR